MTEQQPTPHDKALHAFETGLLFAAALYALADILNYLASHTVRHHLGTLGRLILILAVLYGILAWANVAFASFWGN